MKENKVHRGEAMTERPDDDEHEAGDIYVTQTSTAEMRNGGGGKHQIRVERTRRLSSSTN